MTIQALDWVMYVIILIIMWKCFPKDWKEEMGAIFGGIVVIVYTIVYCIVFWFYSWREIFEAIGLLEVNISW